MIKAVQMICVTFYTSEKSLIFVCLNKLLVNYFCCMQEMTFHIIPAFCFSFTALGMGGGFNVSFIIGGIWGLLLDISALTDPRCLPPLLAGGCLWKHPPHHTGDEQRSDAF